jgi:hypothetical protein
MQGVCHQEDQMDGYARSKSSNQGQASFKALIAFSVGIGHIGGSKVSHYGSSSL